jgi:pimeloyl-ACP methyl ester carboxylesterase
MMADASRDGKGADVPERTIRIDDIDVRMTEQGDGDTTLLWLHGYGGHPGGAPFVGELAERFRVLVPEHPGFGGTERLPWVRTREDMALYYRHVLRQVAPGSPVVLAGHSLGGWLAAEVAIRFSHLLEALVLVAPMGLRLADRPVADIFMLTDEEREVLEWHDRSRMPAPPEDPLAPIRDREMTAQLAWEPRLFDPRLHERLRWIDVPTVLVWGEHDGVVDPAYAAVWASGIGAAETVVVPDAAHLPHVEQPGPFAAAVVEALDRRREEQ